LFLKLQDFLLAWKELFRLKMFLRLPLLLPQTKLLLMLGLMPIFRLLQALMTVPVALWLKYLL
jgi:hypothetical protein